MADIGQLERALVNADAAGDVEAARALASEIKRQRTTSDPKGEVAPPTFAESVRTNLAAPEIGRGSGNPLTAGISQGVAGLLSLPGQTVQNVLNLSRAATGAVAGAAGRPDLMPNADVQVPGNFQSVLNLLNSIGLNTKNAEPNNPAYRALEIAGAAAPALAIPGASPGQTAASATGQFIGEQVGGDTGGMIGALAPAAASAAYNAARQPALNRAQTQNQLKDDAAVQAREQGYTLPPTETNPSSWLNRILEGAAGKLTTRQVASAKNAEVTARLAKESIGLPRDQPLTEAAVRTVRSNAGQVYEQVKQFGAQNNLRMRTDAAFRNDVRSLDQDISAAAREFPDLVNVPGIGNLQQSLNVATVSPTAAVELVKNLRFQATENAKALGDPQRRAMMHAQRAAADAVEGLIERTLARSGQQQLYTDFRNARTIIARTHDIEAAMNPATGTVDARILGNMDRKGKPLGGGLEVAARTQQAFPKAMQTPESIGSQPGFSPLDLFASSALTVGGSAVGGPAGALAGAIPLIRPAARAGILSRPYQNAMGTPNYEAFLQPDSPLAALMRGNLATMQQQ